MSKIDKNLLNETELLPPFKDSQGYCQWDGPVVSFVLALGDQWPHLDLLELHHHIAQVWVVGFVHELECDRLLLSRGVRHYR